MNGLGRTGGMNAHEGLEGTCCVGNSCGGALCDKNKLEGGKGMKLT